jgi:hypothetical protein
MGTALFLLKIIYLSEICQTCELNYSVKLVLLITVKKSLKKLEIYLIWKPKLLRNSMNLSLVCITTKACGILNSEGNVQCWRR